MTLTDEYWSSALKMTHTSSICARHGLIQAKIIFKIHFTRSRLAHIYPNVSDSCIRCSHSPADHVHTFILCSKLASFWKGVFDTIGMAYKTTIPLDPLLAIFGVSPAPLHPICLNRVFSFSTLLARKIILLKWKDPIAPTLLSWKYELVASIKLEKLRHSLRDSQISFESTWGPLQLLLESNMKPKP